MIKDLSDEEIIESVMESLNEDGRVRTEFIKVESVRGKPVLNGCVGSDKELQIVDEILRDVLDLDEYENNLWVDDTLAFEESNEDESAASLSEINEENELDTEEVFNGSDEDED